MSRHQRHFERLHQPQAQMVAQQSGSTLIWPFGAIEQHGPQLPLITDALFADQILNAVLDRLPKELPIWRLPTQTIGFSPEHGDFPGTLSLPAELLIQMVGSVGSQLASMGFRRLILFNAHGGQIALLQVAARQLRSHAPSMAVLPCFLWSGVEGLSSLVSDEELNHGLHAGQAETSLMLHLAPDLVGAARHRDGMPDAMAVSPPPGWSLEGAAPTAWLTSDLSETGVIGDSRASSDALGKALADRLIDHWYELLTALLTSDWPATTRGRAS